jgi:DnaB-like helicase C terminal domain
MDENIDNLIAKETELKNYCGEYECIYSFDLHELLKARADSKPNVSLRSGIPKLDSYIHYFSGGELVVISGPTKHGKTLFAQSLTKNFYDPKITEGAASLWFTYEVPAYQFLNQFGDNPPVFIMPKQLLQNSFRWLEERIWESKLKFNIKAVFIDNTHNLVDTAVNNLSNVIGELLKFLKMLALKFDIVIFLLHHIVKGKIEDGEQIGSHLLRDSSMVSQTADTVFFIWRKEEKDGNGQKTGRMTNQSVIKITENRAFGVMNEYVDLIKIGSFLEECICQETGIR